MCVLWLGLETLVFSRVSYGWGSKPSCFYVCPMAGARNSRVFICVLWLSLESEGVFTCVLYGWGSVLCLGLETLVFSCASYGWVSKLSRFHMCPMAGSRNSRVFTPGVPGCLLGAPKSTSTLGPSYVCRRGPLSRCVNSHMGTKFSRMSLQYSF